MTPASDSSSPAISRKVVVLPAPVGPRRTKNSPSAISRDRSSRAAFEPYLLVTFASLMRAIVGPCLQRTSGFRIEEMGLRRIQSRPHPVAGSGDEAARRTRPDELGADLEIDDVIRAQGLDQVCIDRDVPRGFGKRDHDALGTDAQGQSRVCAR